MKNVRKKVKEKSEKKRNEKNEKVLKKNVTRKRRKGKKEYFIFLPRLATSLNLPGVQARRRFFLRVWVAIILAFGIPGATAPLACSLFFLFLVKIQLIHGPKEWKTNFAQEGYTYGYEVSQIFKIEKNFRSFMKLHLLTINKLQFFLTYFQVFQNFIFFKSFFYIFAVDKSTTKFPHTLQVIEFYHILCFVLTICDSYYLRSLIAPFVCNLQTIQILK